MGCDDFLEYFVYGIHGSVKRIGDHAFHCCKALREMPLTEAESIGAYAFYACDRLGPAAKVSKDCEHIGEKAFDYCDMLRSLYVPKALANFRYESMDWKHRRCSTLSYGYVD